MSSTPIREMTEELGDLMLRGGPVERQTRPLVWLSSSPRSRDVASIRRPDRPAGAGDFNPSASQ